MLYTANISISFKPPVRFSDTKTVSLEVGIASFSSPRNRTKTEFGVILADALGDVPPLKASISVIPDDPVTETRENTISELPEEAV